MTCRIPPFAPYSIFKYLCNFYMMIIFMSQKHMMYILCQSLQRGEHGGNAFIFIVFFRDHELIFLRSRKNKLFYIVRKHYNKYTFCLN